MSALETAEIEAGGESTSLVCPRSMRYAHPVSFKARHYLNTLSTSAFLSGNSRLKIVAVTLQSIEKSYEPITALKCSSLILKVLDNKIRIINSICENVTMNFPIEVKSRVAGSTSRFLLSVIRRARAAVRPCK
jgi:hypothetical protein